MSLKSRLKGLRDTYVINQGMGAKLPAFSDTEVRRFRIRFSGRVQKVGFRLEVCVLAKRLGLTGFCQNLENGDVLAELQGPKDRIWFLVQFMESLKRIKIREKVVDELAVDEREREFIQR